MNSILPLVEFFYNILPGAYFLLLINSNERLIDFIGKNCLNIPPAFLSFNGIITLLIIFGLLVGFLFQALTKIVRYLGLTNKMLDLAIKSNPDVFKKAKSVLVSYGIIDKDYCDNLQCLYLMDNYLNTNNTNTLPTYFSGRTSLWFNLGWANLSLFFISNDFPKAYFLILSAIAFGVAAANLRTLFDTIIKSFVMQFVMQKDNLLFLKKPPKKTQSSGRGGGN